MADGPDWNQAATIASGVMQVVGGAVKDKFAGATNADGATWDTLALSAVATVIAWTVVNTGSVALDVGLGESVLAITLQPGDSWSPPYNGALHVKSASAAAGAYEAVAVGVA